MNTIREQTENLDELPQQQLKITSQNTTKFCFTQTSPNSPPFDLESHIPTSSDTSFEQSMHLENLELVRVAADKFLESCLPQKYNKIEGFKDSNLYQVPAFQFKGENELENITLHNELLNQNMTKQLLAILEKEEGLIGFMKQIPQNFGMTVAKELVYVIWHILHHKIEQFRQLTTIQEPIIPKIPCFQQCEQDMLCRLATSCPVYEDINIEEITSFSEKGINNCAHELFFGDIKILNLKEVTCQCKKGVNVIEKFSKFVSQISRAVFLTLVGATEPPQGIYGLSMSRQISLAELSEGGLSNQRSFSRPLAPCEDDQSYDFISKKIKFD